MFLKPLELTINAIDASDVLNWLLPSLGGLAAILVVIFVWRYLRKGNQVGRISEFNERAFKKLVGDEGSPDHPFCDKCKLPMRVEIKYKDFLQDQGEFTFEKKSLEETLVALEQSGRILNEDTARIREFFKANNSITEQIFRRYKCTECQKVEVLPFPLGK